LKSQQVVEKWACLSLSLVILKSFYSASIQSLPGPGSEQEHFGMTGIVWMD